MADFSPNFVNPSYATPEQVAQQRAYAAELQKRSGSDTNRPTGAAANFIDALMGGIARNRADTIQTEAAQRNAADQAALIAQLQGGRANPGTLGTILANPMASPETRALAVHLLTMKQGEDVAGRPAFASPATGVVAAPVTGGYQPGYRAPESAGSVSTVSPVPAPPLAPAPKAMPMTPTNPQGGVFGGLNYKPDGWAPGSPQPPGSGGQAPGAGLPTAPAPAASRIDQLAAKDRELTAAKTFTQGGAESITGVQKEDVAAAMNAPTIKRIAGTMLDDLRTHGDKMTFGPTAEWSNKIKKVAANYAPGLMKDQLESLASADSFDKMSAQLASMLAKGGGTDAQLFNNMKSVPGAHNSKEGAEALLKMVNQVADQQQALREYVAPARTMQEYETLRSRFFRENPVVNPITGNPIALDLQRGASAAPGRARIISVEPIR